MQKISPSSFIQSQMPNLISMTYDDSLGGVIFTWGADPVDIFPYNHILVDYRSPSNTKTDIKLNKAARSFTVPFGGSGDYVIQIRYVVTPVEGLGYSGEVLGSVWTYTLDAGNIETKLSIPTNLQLNMVKTLAVASANNQGELIPAPTGYGFISSFSFNIPDRVANLEVASNKQPFSLEYTSASITAGATWTELTYFGSNPTLKANVSVVDGNPKIILQKSDLTQSQAFKLGGWFRVKARYVDGGFDSVKDSDWVMIQIPTDVPSESLFNPEDVYQQQLN